MVFIIRADSVCVYSEELIFLKNVLKFTNKDGVEEIIASTIYYNFITILTSEYFLVYNIGSYNLEVKI